MDIAPADLARVRELYHSGHYLSAYRAAEAVAPLRNWTGPAARLLAGRLAIQLGAPKLGRRLHLVAFRESPAYPEAVYYHARYRLERFGPFSAWRFMRAHPDWSDAGPDLHADWLALAAVVAARFRDFDRAERLLNRADQVAPDRPWPLVERSAVYEFAERTEDALAAARRALELQPRFRPAVQSVAHMTMRLGRDTEALAFLQEADAHLESGLIAAQVAALLIDAGRYTEARGALDRYEHLSPLMEADVAKWLHARRADCAYYLGETAAAAPLAKLVKEEHYDAFAARLEAGAAPRGRALVPIELTPGAPVPAPAELLAGYWKCALPDPADAPPAFDGLPDAGERARAEAAGWVCREFTLCPEVGGALAARGVPFLLTLVEAGFSQARACVHADPVRGSVTVIDGLDRRPIDAPVGSLLERFEPFGPRCLALVPAEHAAKLDGLPPLPDAAARDALYAVQKPLLAHDRGAADAALRVLREAFPGSTFALFGELALARYDAHPLKLLAAYDALLAEFPDEPTWVLSKANVLRELNRMPERLALLEAAGAPLGAEAMVAQTLAQALLPLPHRQYDAGVLLRHSLRARPTAASGYYLLGTQWWEHRQFDEAAELYRFACALEEREDQFAEAYFRATRVTEQVPEALRLFQQRAGRAAVPVPAATRALYHALMDRDEPEQAAVALDQAIKKLEEKRQEPADNKQKADDARAALGELLLFRAERSAGAGKRDRAAADLEAAKPLVTPVTWHKAAARVARVEPDFASAGAHFLEVIRIEPLAIESHRTLTVLLAETDGRAAARAHLAQACQKHPHFYPLLKFRAEFESGDPQGGAEAAARAMLAEHPDDAWALRQHALLLAEDKKHDAALAAVERGGAIEPGHQWYYSVLAQVHRRADRTAEALAALRDALKRNIDQEPLIAELVQLSRGRREKREALAFVADELRRQPHAGDGLLAFVSTAHTVYQANGDPDDHTELLATLEGFLDDRPDLWQAWSAAVQQMAGLGRLEEAHALARDACERFPLLGKLWLDLAQVCHALGNADGRVEALRQAVAVSPGWTPAARELADALDEAEERDEAVRVLERAAARNPTDALAHGFLAERLWDAGRSREALDRAKTAVRLEPGYDWAWHHVQLWAERLECPEEPVELTRALTRDRAGDTRAWLRLARMLHHPRHNDEVLAALDKALALEPKNVEAHDLKAERLAEMGRFEAALEAALPPQFEDDRPILLQGREAWVQARRGNYAAAITRMQALVAVDPTYVWGWHQLAEWYNETNKPESYLEAAAELVRLQPHHPTGWGMRGEAKIQTGDREGGKSDLREALKISPGYSLAAAILFDAHLADDEFREARQALAVLQEHAAGPEVAVKQVQLAARTDDAEGAARAFAEICEGPGQSGYPIQAALTELRAADWGDRGTDVLRETWQSGGPFNPWVPIFWIESPEGESAEPGERVRAAEAAIRAYPKFVPGHDCKAEQLALAGRHDEALAACHPDELGEPVPVELRSRAAWIEAKRGDRNRAIAQMKQVVADFPAFVPGWRHLCAWYDTTGRGRECLEAAERFVDLEPNNPLAYVYRGEARRGVDDRRGALADFARAFELDPAFDAAGLNLIAEQLAADDIAGAARALAALKEHNDGPLVRLRAVQVACRQGEPDAAAARLQELAEGDGASRAVVREAVGAFDAAGWGARATDELRARAFEPGANPEVAGLWAERAATATAPEAVAARLPELVPLNPDAGREAVLSTVWALAATGKPVQPVVQQYGELLRSDDASWARAGAALAAAGNHAGAAAWLADWRDRADAEAWMLRPLALAYRMLDQDDRAAEVCRAAVKLGGPDDVLSDFRAWLALDLALAGQTDDAQAQVSKVDAVGLSDGTRLVLALAEAVLMVRRAGPGGRSAAFREAKEHLKSAAGSCAATDVPAGAARAYRRVVSCVSGIAGTLSAKLWAVWQRLAPWVK
jgi:predicted Zn-dependent protease